MFGKSQPTPPPASHGSPTMVGSKKPFLHRFHLTDGRVMEGHMYRVPNSRLADFLATLKGFISLTDCTCTRTGERYPYVALNQEHVLFIEEMGNIGHR